MQTIMSKILKCIWNTINFINKCLLVCPFLCPSWLLALWSCHSSSLPGVLPQRGGWSSHSHSRRERSGRERSTSAATCLGQCSSCTDSHTWCSPLWPYWPGTGAGLRWCGCSSACWPPAVENNRRDAGRRWPPLCYQHKVSLHPRAQSMKAAGECINYVPKFYINWR